MDNKEYGVKLNLDLSKFQKNLQKAKEMTQKAKNDIEEPLRKVKINGEERELKIKADTSELKRDLKETAEDFEKRMANIKPKIYNHVGMDYDANILNPTATRDNYTPEATDEGMKKFIEGVRSFEKEVGDAVDGVANNLKAQLDPLTEKYAQLAQQYRELTTSNYGDLIAESDAQEAERIKHEIQGIISEMEKISGEKYIAKGITEPLEEAEKKTTGMKFHFSDLGKNIGKSIDNAVSSLKRFSLSLIGIRGAYTMLTRASNAYMSQDSELSNKMQANWIALGAVLSPIIERLVELFRRFVAYVNVFYKAFTGKNLIEIAMKKVQKTSTAAQKAVKGLSSELANLDEITNLSKDETGGVSDLGVSAPGVEDALKDLNDIKLNPEIVKILETLAKKLKKVFEWIGKNEDKLKIFIAVASGLYAGFKFVKIINKLSEVAGGIGTILGSEAAVTGLLGITVALGIIADFLLAKKLGEKLAELMDVNYEKQQASNGLTNSRLKILETVVGVLKDETKTEEQKNVALEEAKDAYKQYYEDLKNGRKVSKEQREEIEKQVKAIEKVSGKKFKATIEAEVNAEMSQKSKNWWDNFVDSIGWSIGNVVKNIQESIKGSSGSGSSSGKGRHFAKGNVAYEPTYAEFGEYSGARSNPEITAPQNIMRETLAEALTETLPLINTGQSGDTVLYVNGRELARATHQDFQNESNRLGTSNIAIRRV